MRKTQEVLENLKNKGLSEKEIERIIPRGTIKWDKAIELHPGDRLVRSIFIGGG